MRLRALSGQNEPTASFFQTQLVLGYVPWLLCFAVYLWPRLKTMDPVAAHRAIATLHSFRFFGLRFLVPGVARVSPPPSPSPPPMATSPPACSQCWRS
jgi:hypothetical protein